jgi:hypothetical protein
VYVKTRKLPPLIFGSILSVGLRVPIFVMAYLKTLSVAQAVEWEVNY